MLAAVADDPGCAGYEQCRVYLSAGGDIGPNLSRHTHRVAEGDVIWVDAGCQVDGYAADIGRTFTVGPATPLVRRIATALEAGSAAGLLLRPGTPLADIYRATQEAVRANGLPTYTRGHFGHGIGAGIGEAPLYLRGHYRRADAGDGAGVRTPLLPPRPRRIPVRGELRGHRGRRGHIHVAAANLTELSAGHAAPARLAAIVRTTRRKQCTH